jgi:uncharacterized protein (DUF1697 family)
MQRYAAFLRGVSPMNARMPQLKRCFEAAGFSDVRTLLSSGNVAFSTRATSEGALVRRIEAALQEDLGQPFLTIVRSIDGLQALLASDPYKRFRLAPGSKRVVTFLRGEVRSPPKLPVELDGARILCVWRSEVFSAYIPGPRGPVFMSLIEKTFGKEVTTRTWDTVRKVAAG